jgi:hypothetical protein
MSVLGSFPLLGLVVSSASFAPFTQGKNSARFEQGKVVQRTFANSVGPTLLAGMALPRSQKPLQTSGPNAGFMVAHVPIGEDGQPAIRENTSDRLVDSASCRQDDGVYPDRGGNAIVTVTVLCCSLLWPIPSRSYSGAVSQSYLRAKCEAR